MYKSFIACIYLQDKKAVKGFQDRSVVSEDPVALAESYAEKDVDALIVFDLSSNDIAQEEAITVIRRMTEHLRIPVYAAGNIKRMEDVKKLLYAGCSEVILNLGKDSTMELIEEVSLKFGKDKIAGSVSGSDLTSLDKMLLENYVKELVVIDEKALKYWLEHSPLPLISMLPELPLENMLALMENEKLSGISGSLVNANYKDISALKQICKERGINTHIFAPVMAFSEFKLNSDGMIPVVTQDYRTGQVLMVAYMNEEAYLTTLRTGKMTYFSRSRNELWIKGDTSGHYQYVKGLHIDCDNDTLLAKVSQVGAACHTGSYSCFFRSIVPDEDVQTNPLTVFEEVFKVIQDRRSNPKNGSYTNYLFDKGTDKILKKLGEEATEIVIAAKNDNTDEIKYEISDFLYHLMVLMAEKGISWEDVTKELANR